MKRTEALTQLSRDHHQSLFVALRLKQATDDSLPEVIELLTQHWNEHAGPHFDIEEEVLLAAFAEHGGAGDPMAERVTREHAELRAAITGLITADSPDLAATHELATALKDHVRFEEREFFPRLEEVLPEQVLIDVAAAVERAEAGS